MIQARGYCFLPLILALSPCAIRAEVLAPVSHRFNGNENEAPHFQRHVIPLLGKLGCNGRACHGSFQGQGGFRLSLFGYDFEADHRAITGGEKPRAQIANPRDSLFLKKPTRTVRHKGGRRFTTDSWEYRLLHQWLKHGAKALGKDEPTLAQLEVEPKEILFQATGDRKPLRVVASWSNGIQEDVTPLCRFRTNDDSIAEVDKEGNVTAVGKGDTHIIVFYDNGIAAIPVVLPLSTSHGNKYPKVAAPTKVDRLIVDKLRKVGIVPSALSTDAEFLRRVSLDLTGALPTPREVTAFLADRSASKRAKKIDELLKRPGYAALLTSRLCDWTGNSEQNLPVGGEQGVRQEKSALWYQWLYHRVAKNVGYDQIVEGMVMAVSRRPGQSDDDYFAEMSSYFREKNPRDFSQRPTMPYFWSRGRFSPPQTLRFSYAFLGVRLECAQCHKHPYDQWTQSDYEGFKAFFEQIRFRYSSTRGKVKELKKALGLTADQDSGQYKRLFARLAQEGTVVPWGEVVAPNWKRGRKPSRSRKRASGRVITPRLLGGERVMAQLYSDPREPVMQWLKQKDNPYFARVIVNRVWAALFGKGIIDPPDDMNLANPASNEPLLDYLAQGFIENRYDLKWLHREIANSRAYQRSWKTTTTNEKDERNFSRAILRRLPAEVLYDAIGMATASKEDQQKMQLDRDSVLKRQIGFPKTGRKSSAGYALKLFGKPAREQVCDCERSNEPSLLQTVYLRNDEEMLSRLDRRGGWLDGLKSKPLMWLQDHRDGLLQEAWLRVLSRPPRADELKLAREHLGRSNDTLSGLRDLIWALINTKEFLLNH